MVVKEYKYEKATVRIHDDFLLKDKAEIEKILEEIAKIYSRAFERKMLEGVSQMHKRMVFNMDKAMKHLGYLTISVLLLGETYVVFMGMLERMCR